ncbi:Serine carboxypeptidase-like 34, partial [Dichanthelium oligosanthes]
LVNWFERSPQSKGHDFYIAGESYAGHYVPQLADKIVEMNSKIDRNRHIINLKGIMVHNRGMVEYAWNHAIISDELYAALGKDCNFSDDVTESDFSHLSSAATHEWSDTCNSAMEAFDRAAYDIIDGYHVKALHANATGRIPYRWAPCNRNLSESWQDSPASTLPVIKRMVDAGLRVWVYSGDTDARVSVTSTRYALRKLRLPTVRQWREWYTSDQVGGYTVADDGLTFATVRGAGHMVPRFTPVQARQLFAHFLAGEELSPTPVAATSA